eukprot:TRINITY_DN393_c0_g1_i1.p1 TRINITY_DN393_c0_g1~~TRINITY_DN393_c0_g1_i1.p1  ORF type:complete len:118 (-),score=15.24 TRINITY_DN393_c0_g1_i1:131-484(-)
MYDTQSTSQSKPPQINSLRTSKRGTGYKNASQKSDESESEVKEWRGRKVPPLRFIFAEEFERKEHGGKQQISGGHEFQRVPLDTPRTATPTSSSGKSTNELMAVGIEMTKILDCNKF